LIQEIGVIESLEGELALIKAERTGSCDHCASKSMCNPSDGKEYIIVHAVNTIGAKEGEWVRFSVPVDSFLKASLIVYAIPLIALLIGSVIGRVLFPYVSESFSKDGISALTALIFLVASIFFVKLIGKHTDDEKYMPKIIQIIGQ
jgi:sigma-E factor negative regulatory protein RseC